MSNKYNPYQATEDFHNIEEGLKNRGFIGMEGMDSLGKCHKNEKHYILRTDGLIIYSNIWDAHANNDFISKSKDIYNISWDMTEFTFEKLDEVIKIVEL